MSFGSYKGDTNVLEIVFVDLYNGTLIHREDFKIPNTRRFLGIFKNPHSARSLWISIVSKWNQYHPTSCTFLTYGGAEWGAEWGLAFGPVSGPFCHKRGAGDKGGDSSRNRQKSGSFGDF